MSPELNEGKKDMTDIIQVEAMDLIRLGGARWRVTREGCEDRIYDEWDEAFDYFRGDPDLFVERTIQAVGE